MGNREPGFAGLGRRAGGRLPPSCLSWAHALSCTMPMAAFTCPLLCCQPLSCHPTLMHAHTCPHARTHPAGAFGPAEDAMFRAATEWALEERLPLVYLAANSGARVGLANEVKQCLRVRAGGATAHPAAPLDACLDLLPAGSLGGHATSAVASHTTTHPHSYPHAPQPHPLTFSFPPARWNGQTTPTPPRASATCTCRPRTTPRSARAAGAPPCSRRNGWSPRTARSASS